MSRTYLYVVGREEGPVKVGISTNVLSRMRALQTGCPFKLELLAMFRFDTREDAASQESFFHECYADVRTSGEWFRIEADLAIEGVDGNISMREHFAELDRSKHGSYQNH